MRAGFELPPGADDQQEASSSVAVGSFAIWMQKSCRERVAAPDQGAQTSFRVAARIIAAPGTHLSCAESESVGDASYGPVCRLAPADS